MKSQEEIVKRFNDRKEDDFLGFEVGEYVSFLDYDHAKEIDIVKEGVSKEKWNDTYKEPNEDNIKYAMEDYMPFAWEKANDCRGISANRSISHYEAWIWLLGDDEFLKKLGEIEYEHYGKEKLIAICEKYEWDWGKWDDGVRTNFG